MPIAAAQPPLAYCHRDPTKHVKRAKQMIVSNRTYGSDPEIESVSANAMLKMK